MAVVDVRVKGDTIVRCTNCRATARVGADVGHRDWCQIPDRDFDTYVTQGYYAVEVDGRFDPGHVPVT